MKFSFNYNQNKLPEPLMKLFQPNKDALTYNTSHDKRMGDIHTYNTRHKRAIKIAKHKTSIYNRSFLCKCSTMWINLSMELKNLEKVSIFSKKFNETKIYRY